MRIAIREDIPFINRVLNDPTVRPYVFEGEEPLDIEPVFDYVLCYVSEHGVIFCEALGNARYMALVAFLPPGRGIHAATCQRHVIDHLYATTDCETVYANCFTTNHRGYRNMKAMLPKISKIGKMVVGEMTWMDWFKHSRTCLLRGAEFQDEEKDLKRALGGFCLMAENGQGPKALKLWNIYSKLSHVPDILPMSEDRPIYAYDGKVLRF